MIGKIVYFDLDSEELELLKSSLERVFPDGSVIYIEIKGNLGYKLKEYLKDPTILLAVVKGNVNSNNSSAQKLVEKFTKGIYFSNINELIRCLNSMFSLSIELKADVVDTMRVLDLENQLKDYKMLISNLQQRILEYESGEGTVSVEIQEQLDSLKAENSKLKDDYNLTNIRLQSSIKEIESLSIDTLEFDKSKASVRKLTNEVENLKEKLGTADSELAQKATQIKDLTAKLANKSSTVENLSANLDKVNKDLVLANGKIIELNSKIKASDISKDYTKVESLLSELNNLKQMYSGLRLDIFTRVGEAIGKQIPKLMVGGLDCNNIRFVFSGSTESKKGTYKCLYNKFKKDKSSKILLIDATSESFSDYVFKIKNVINGTNWLSCGGDIEQYLSNTSLENVKVLSTGVGYINDSCFLKVNWLQRIKELNSLDYKVYIYFGDICNIVGRVLYETFGEYRNADIYVMGTAISCRSIVENLQGLSKYPETCIYYFNFNQKLKKFYDMLGDYNTNIIEKGEL